jgi:acetate kinase
MSLDSRTVLALNLGSSSLKAVSYSLPARTANQRSAAQETARVSVEIAQGTGAPDLLADAMRQLADSQQQPGAVVHRIVHGGDRAHAVELTPGTLTELHALAPLAPLHQPPALALVRATIQRWPAARQVGAFDTSWHQTMPEKHRLLPIPYALYSAGVKRYGFHGLAFQSAMRQLASLAPGLSKGRIVLAHLGGGSSLCGVLDGASVSTTMGMTPLGGIAMATRSGSLDPGVLLHLQRSLGLTPGQVEQLLWSDSGLKGLSGEPGDMRALLASASSGAARAIDVYVSSVVQGVAAMAACLGGIEALVFSGGIGMHAAAIRGRVANELGWLGLAIDPALNRAGVLELSAAQTKVRTFVLPVDECAEMIAAIA